MTRALVELALTLMACQLLAGGAALAQSGGPAMKAGLLRAQTKATPCPPRSGLLGIARVVEVDAAHGPRLGGGHQHLDSEFLRDGEIVLTFDDGPMRRYTQKVLEALAAHCTQATFFMLGNMAVSDPDMVREVARAGHTIGSHTWSHRNVRQLSLAAAQHEIELGLSAVQRSLGGRISPFFRFPGLNETPETLSYLASRNIAVLAVDADSKDYQTADAQQMLRTLLIHLSAKRKGILLFHDIQASTAAGIRGVLDELARLGYRVVHLVPKRPASTLANYDAMAAVEYARRGTLASGGSLAHRAVVAPLMPPASAQRHEPRSGPDQRVAVPPPSTAPVAGPASVPVPVLATRPPAPAAGGQVPPAGGEPQQPGLRGSAEDDWRLRIFQN